MRLPYHHGALRQALLEAAEASLEEGGQQALTLRAVARRVGVTHAAPKPHFGDLNGLLTALATSGFMRLRERFEDALSTAAASPSARRIALGRSYIIFARAHPGLFQLMLRSDRLDWGSPTLAAAGQAAFELLTEDHPENDKPPIPREFEKLVTSVSRWSLMHGLATLLVDGRIGPLVDEAPNGDIDTLIDGVLARLALP